MADPVLDGRTRSNENHSPLAPLPVSLPLSDRSAHLVRDRPRACIGLRPVSGLASSYTGALA